MVNKCPLCNQPDPLYSKKRALYICEYCAHEFIPEEQFFPQRIFISYGHDEHTSLALQLRDDLRESGHEVWFDEERLLPSKDWEARIEEGLNWTAEGKPHAAVILLLTPHSVRRPEGYCLNEVARALMLNLRIIPLMVVESEPPLSICRIQWLDMRECIPIHEKKALYEPRFQRLLKALEQEELDYEGLQSRLLRTLQPIEFSADLFKLLRDFTGRKWVFDEIDGWFENSAGPKLFWLTGAPGVGKSAVAAWVREHRREVAAYHFCDINSEEKRNPAKLVCSIAYQLSTQLPEYQERLGRLDLENIVQEYHEAYTLFDKLLVQPLSEGYPAPDRTIVILIDALDEATSRRQNEIVRLLSRSADKTPPWLRFLVTSRPETEITSSFQVLSPYILDTDRSENLADLRQYITTMIPDITAAQTEELLKCSEGVFLYISHVVAGIKAETLDLERMEDFPRGLGDIYQQFFDRQFGQDLNYYEEKIVPLLQPIIASYEPLTQQFLKTVCSIEEDTELERRLNRLGSLFPLSGEGAAETIRPFHRSVSDWITDRKSAGHFVVAETDGHRVLAEYCWQEYLTDVEALSPYALSFLPAHLVVANRFDDLIGDEGRPGPLTDLRFIQAKCEAGLVYELVNDYNLALKELPEFREEQEYLREHEKAMRAYNKALNDYAVKRYEYLQQKDKGGVQPEPPYPELPEILMDEKRPPLPEQNSERAAHLRHYANFVFGHTGPIKSDPKLVKQISHNYANESPVADAGEKLLKDFSYPLLIRYPRPQCPPLRPQCLRILEGHAKKVWSVSVTPDGKYAVSGGDDKKLCIWDLESGECLRVLKGHSGWVRAVAITPDGKHAVSGSSDKTMRLWDLETGECLRIIDHYCGVVSAVSVTKDSSKVISGSWDNKLYLWDLNREECLLSFKGHDGLVRCVAVTPDGNRAVSGSIDKTIRVWDLNSGKCLRLMEGHKGTVRSISLTPDGRKVISGSDDKKLIVWNLENGEYQLELEGHNGWIRSVSVTPDGKRVLSGSEDNSIRMWDLETGECLQVFKGHSGMVRSVSVAPNGRRLISGGYNQSLRLWDIDSKETLHKPQGHNDSVRGLSVTPDGKQAVSGSWDMTIRLWNLSNGKSQQILKGHNDRVRSISVMHDGKRAVSGSDDKTLRVWNLETGECLKIMEGHEDWVMSICVTPDDKFVVSGSADKTLRLWDIEGGICLKAMEGHSDWIRIVGVTPDGKRVISGSDDKDLRLWDLKSGKCLEKIRGHSDWVRSLAIMPDGNTVVSGSNDKTIRIWSLISGKCLCILEGHKGPVRGVCVMLDNKVIVSGSDDKTLRVWNIETENCFAVYHALYNVNCLAKSQVSNSIMCGLRDGQMHFLTPVNFPPPGPAITTAVRLWLFGDANEPGRWDDKLTSLCNWCGKRFTISDDMLGKQVTCLHQDCHRSLHINPFIVDGRV